MILAVVVTDPLQHLNALKNAAIMLVSGTAAILFLFIAHISWPPAMLLAASSIAGGQVGASVGPASLARGASSFHRVRWFGRGDQAAPLKRFGPP
jgi:uncharacterized membrane protein YfcA